jgi:hypothetical protein
VSALVAVAAVLVVLFLASALVERVLGRSRKEMAKPGWYIVFFPAVVLALLLVYSTFSTSSPFIYAAYALAGGLAALLAQCLFGAKLQDPHSSRGR